MTNDDDEEIRMHLQKFIPKRLSQLDMSPSDLSRATGDSPTQIHRAMTGKATPTAGFLRRLSRALNCSADELLKNEIMSAH